MKYVWALALVMLISGPVFAMNPGPTPTPSPAPAPTLKEHMETLDKTYKLILRQINKPDMNPSSITMFQTLEKVTYECIVMLPKMLRAEAATEAATEAEIRIKQILYMKMMSQLLIMILDGEDMLQKKDNAGAKGILGKMAELKFQGHQIFDPEG